MPRSREVPSLRQTCLRHISSNLELVCYGVEAWGLAIFLNQVDLTTVELDSLPISRLPAPLLSDLLDSACRDGLVSQHVLHVLLQPHLRHCRILQNVNLYHATRLLSMRCTNLTNLELSHCKTLSPTYLADFFCHFPMLAVLNLQGTLLDELCLASIAATCHRLVNLNLSQSNLTDEGLARLSKPDEPTSPPPCPLLVHLNLADTDVIPFSVYEFIVHHKRLQTLEYGSLQEVLRCYFLMNDAHGSCSVSQLRSLALHNCPVNLCSSLQNCREIFPCLTAFSVLQTDLTKQTLDCVRQLSHLTKLELGNSAFTQYTVYFHEQVVPVLESLGNRLSELTLEKFKFVDIEAIGEHCPKLQTLRLSRVLSFCNTEHSAKFPLLNLSRLTILNTKGCRITEATLRLLLTSRYLSQLTLQAVDTLTDQFLTSLLQANPMDHLHTLVLQQCHSISPVILNVLVGLVSPLSSLTLASCGMVEEEDRDKLEQVVWEHNMELELKWCSSRLVPLLLEQEHFEEFELIEDWEAV